MMMSNIRVVSCLKFKHIYNLRFYSSALYITGDKAQSNFVVLRPFIDFDEQLANKSELVKNIQARKLNIDLDKIEKRWNFYKIIDENKNILELTRNEISKNISELKQDPEKNKSEIEKLLLHIKLVKDDLKNIKDYSYGIEENANVSVLKLPNILHPKTPLDVETVIHKFKEQPQHKSQSHLTIGTKSNLIEYTNPIFYFLKNDASRFEFAITNYFQDSLLKANFTQFSNADFARSIVIEGCGADYLDKSKVFTLQDPHDEKLHEISKLHLVGGASLFSFMAYFAKHSVQHNVLPLKLFSVGRNYKPVSDESHSFGLFNLSQESNISLFVACEDDSKVFNELLCSLVGDVIKIYESLHDYHFRVIYKTADQLEVSESLRVSIQMFSNHLQDYIEIGHLSVFDNYLSKRLLFMYKQGKEQKFTKIIAGSVFSVQKFLGCALENSENKVPFISDLLRKFL